jgi:small GTP-binding protein
MSSSVLAPDRQEVVRRLRQTLQDLRAALVRAGVPAEDEQTLRTVVDQLDGFFLLVIVGEFNAGKSALINALLGETILEEGVTPTTTEVQVLRHADQPSTEDATLRTLTARSPLLRDVRLVDTPGTNAISREHEVITSRFVPRADLILFVTSADRPFTESERQFMAAIRGWGKKILVAINKADILHGPAEVQAVVEFVRTNVTALLGVTPEIFTVTARGAMAAKRAGDTAALRDSGFAALENYILTSLNDTERFRLKVASPIGVGVSLIDRTLPIIADKLAVLGDDVATVAEIRSLLDGYRRDMARTFELRLTDVDNLLLQFGKKGDEFFEETVRVGRIFDLLNKSKIRADFERQVIGDLPAQIAQRVERVIDWLVESEHRQWAEVRDRLTRRRTDHADRIAGRLAGTFAQDRARLLETVGRAAQNTLDAQDHKAESARIAQSVQSAVQNAALLQAGAVGLGTAVSLVATSTAADVTGILAAGVMATLGFVVLPRRRHHAKKELHERIARLRTELMAAISTQFHQEVERGARRIEDALAPYVQFVEGERENLTARKEEIEALRSALGVIAKNP